MCYTSQKDFDGVITANAVITSCNLYNANCCHYVKNHDMLFLIYIASLLKEIEGPESDSLEALLMTLNGKSGHLDG